ncbi:unnamed protein product [Lactuca virosa]|uniref:SWIM-type domain-containing protein n=1 Tax=Lactuca virosa TaxID=75947 RepID=A0AAU9M524_9ASTR|nr:unnamed protein product [Lactuca virosa]
MMDWDSEHEGNTDPFFGLREPFSGLNEMDFELHGIYMDHEPDKEFITPLDKCKDAFLNVLLSDENIRNSSLTNDVRAQVYHRGNLQSDDDEEEQEQVINKYRLHDPKTRWDKMEPKLGDIFENVTQLKFCIQNYAVHNLYQLYFEKCDRTRIVILDCRFWGIIHSQGHVFEARRGCDSYRVDLDDMTCSCRLWDLAGIPCVHANAAINFIHQAPYAYINAYFSKEKFRQCYSTNIEPVNGSNLWAQTEYIKPLPPMSRRMPGRPATKRKRHASEKERKFSTTKVKVARTTRCGNCLEYAHNKRACKNERKQYVPPPPKKTGRPRKHPIPHVSTSPGQPNVPSQPSCSNTVRRSPRKHNTLRMSPRKHQQQAGAGDEAAGDGGLDDDVGLDVGPDHGAGYEGAGDGDEEGPGGGDVDDGDGPEGDSDEEGHGGGDVDDGEENQGDDEGHQVVPMVRRRTRKTSERITKIKLRKGVYDKDGGGFSSIKPINLE